MVDEDSWRLNMNLSKFRVVSYLYRTLVDVLVEMVSNIYNIAHRLLYDFKDGWYDHLSDTNFVEVSEYAKYSKSRIPFHDI